MTTGTITYYNGGTISAEVVKTVTFTVGVQGPEGIQGPQGVAGNGVPVGGTTGQVLSKNSNSDYDTEWADVAGGGAVSSVFGRTGAVTAQSGDYTKAQVGLDNVDNTSDANKPISSATQTALNAKLDSNTPITGATKTKITYDADGLVTSGADATTSDIADSTNKRYVTDAQQTVLGNTSGTNTGDQISIVGITGTKAQFNTAVTDGNILFTDNTLIDYPYTGLVSGILTGCEVTINADPTKFDISAGTYLVVDWTNEAAPIITPVTFAGVTAQTVTGIATHTFTRLYLNAAGAVVQAPGGLDTPQVRRQYCVLQLISHPNLTTISSVTTNHKHGFEAVESLIDYVKLLGPVIAGNEFSANGANLNIDKSSGVFSALWVNATIDNQDPINKSLAALTAASFTTAYRDGSGGTTFGVATSSVPVLYYDDGTGVLAALANNKYVNLYCYVFNTNQVTLVYGQAFYSSMSAAVAGIATEVFIKPAALAQGGITTVITVKKGATLLNNTAQASFTPYSAGGGGGGAVVSPSANVGEAEVDFGAFPGSNEASIAVTGQASIVAGSKITASVSATATADHTVSDAAYAASLIGVSAGDIIAAIGFTIYARSTQKMQGKFLVNYSWA